MTDLSGHKLYTTCTQPVHTSGLLAAAVCAGFTGALSAHAQDASGVDDAVLATIEELVEDSCIPFIEAERTMLWWFRSDITGEARRSNSSPYRTIFDVPDRPVRFSLRVGNENWNCTFSSPSGEPWSEQTAAAVSDYARRLASTWVVDDRVDVDLSGQVFEQQWIARPNGLRGRFVMFFRGTGPSPTIGTSLSFGISDFTQEAPDA